MKEKVWRFIVVCVWFLFGFVFCVAGKCGGKCECYVSNFCERGRERERGMGIFDAPHALNRDHQRWWVVARFGWSLISVFVK